MQALASPLLLTVIILALVASAVLAVLALRHIDSGPDGLPFPPGRTGLAPIPDYPHAYVRWDHCDDCYATMERTCNTAGRRGYDNPADDDTIVVASAAVARYAGDVAAAAERWSWAEWLADRDSYRAAELRRAGAVWDMLRTGAYSDTPWVRQPVNY